MHYQRMLGFHKKLLSIHWKLSFGCKIFQNWDNFKNIGKAYQQPRKRNILPSLGLWFHSWTGKKSKSAQVKREPQTRLHNILVSLLQTSTFILFSLSFHSRFCLFLELKESLSLSLVNTNDCQDFFVASHWETVSVLFLFQDSAIGLWKKRRGRFSFLYLYRWTTKG